MKQILKVITIPLMALLVVSCATTADFLKVIGSPEQVQSEITVLGALAKPRITSEDVKAKIHYFASELVKLSDLDTSTLVALIPQTGNAAADALIAAGVAYLNSVIAKFGSHNATTLAYAKAVGNGLLANF